MRKRLKRRRHHWRQTADKGGAAPSAVPIPGAAKATGPAGTSATVLDTSAIQGLMGRSVKSYVGEDLGLIVDCLVTPGGQARAVVIDFGGVLGVGSRKVAVDWKALDFAGTAKGAAVVLALTRNEVRVSPEYKAGDPVVVLESTQPEASKTAVSASPAPHPPQAAPGPPPADPKKN